MDATADIAALVRASIELRSALSRSRARLEDLLADVRREESVVRRGLDELRSRQEQRSYSQRQPHQEGREGGARSSRSGCLEGFASLGSVEQLLGSNIVQRSYTADEVRQWRARVDTSISQMTTDSPQFETALGGASPRALQLYVMHLENRTSVIDELWPRYFDASSDDAPIYQPLFSDDSTEHPSNEEGMRLHRKYNV